MATPIQQIFAHFLVFVGVVGVSAFFVLHLQTLNRYVHAHGHVRHLASPRTYAFEPIAFAVCGVSVLTVLHAVNCLIWALFVWGAGAFEGLTDSIFFAFENYTSLGLTRVDVAWKWRLFAPAISFTGIICFAWTGAILAAMFVRIYGASDGS